MDPETVRQRVEKVSSIERIKSNVPKGHRGCDPQL